MATEALIPSELALIQAFVNTADLEDGSDELGTPEGLASWLKGRDLAPAEARFAAEDVVRAQALREALRALPFANNGEELDPRAVETLNAAAADAPLRVVLDHAGAASLAPGRDGMAAVTA